MKTALEQLIDNLDKEALDNTGFYSTGELEVISKIKSRCLNLLETERSQISDAMKYALLNADVPFSGSINGWCNDYINNTYKNELAS
jgi:hypothetical protein